MNAENLVARGVVAGRVEHPARGPAYDRLNVFVGKWITDGQTAPAPGQPSVRITASDIYEWATGGFFIVHTAYGTIGGMPVGGVEIIGYDAEKDVYRTQFFDSQGNRISEELSYRGEGRWLWSGARVRCWGTFSEDGKKLLAQHEKSEDGVTWVPSMEVTLSKA